MDMKPMDMMSTEDKSADMCKGLDQAMSMLGQIQTSDPKSQKILDKVQGLLQQHRDQVMGENESGDELGMEENPEDDAMPPQLSSPYNSSNLKFKNPFGRR